MATKLLKVDINYIKQLILDFFEMDINPSGNPRVKDFIVDEEYSEAYADIKTRNGWYSAYLGFEQKSHNIFPTEIAFSKYEEVV